MSETVRKCPSPFVGFIVGSIWMVLVVAWDGFVPWSYALEWVAASVIALVVVHLLDKTLNMVMARL